MPGWEAVVLHEARDEPVAVGEVGRIAMTLDASPLAWFEGYEGNVAKSADKLTENRRWYLTGDRGQVDEEGYFRFFSRDDDLIIMAGYRIGAFDVESVIALHPAVVECAVIAVPDALRGEVIEAFVVLGNAYSDSVSLAEEIQQWVKTRYAAYAYPRVVHFAAHLPKTPSGKIHRYLLKQQRLDALQRQDASDGKNKLIGRFDSPII